MHTSLPLTVFILGMALSVVAGTEARSGTLKARAVPATVCEINHGRFQRYQRGRLVSITASAWYDFEHGYFLGDPGCMKGKDLENLTGLLRIDFPAKTTDWDYPELAKVASQEWLKGAIGKYVYCTCVGTVTYSAGYPKFVLDHAERVWISDTDIFPTDHRPKI